MGSSEEDSLISDGWSLMGISRSPEPYVDALNGLWDEGEQFVDALNGEYDEGEPFVDANDNGVYDGAEIFVDALNGTYDAGEEFTDALNGVWDEGELFVDSVLNGVYDEGEPFVDINGNNEYDPGRKEYFKEITTFYSNGDDEYWENNISYQTVTIGSPEESFLIDDGWSLNYTIEQSEPFTDQINNGVYDEGEEFIDALNRVYDEGETFIDSNSNGVYDGGEEFVDSLLNHIDSSRLNNIEQFNVEAFFEEPFAFNDPDVVNSLYYVGSSWEYQTEYNEKISLSADGNFMLISQPKATYNNQSSSGKVNLYELRNGIFDPVFEVGGFSAEDYAGYNAKISSDAQTIAIQSSSSEVSGLESSRVNKITVYFNGTSGWNQKGSDIIMSQTEDSLISNFEFDMNDAGDRIVISYFDYVGSSETNYHAGAFEIFDFIDGNWISQGIFEPTNVSGLFAREISISGDGNTIIATLYNDSDSFDDIYVYKFQNELWTLFDTIPHITHTADIGDDTGYEEIVLNADGSVFVCGLGNYDEVIAFKLEGSSYSQLGNVLKGSGKFGMSVDINASGDVILVGAPRASFENFANAGSVQSFKLVNRDWVAMGNPVLGSYQGTSIGMSVSMDASGNNFTFSFARNDYWYNEDEYSSELNPFHYRYVYENVAFDLSNVIITLNNNIQELSCSSNTIDGELNLPYLINGSEYKLSPSAFKDCSLLESISLPSHINEIPESAFENCASLKSIGLSPLMASVGDNAFKNCFNLIISNPLLNIKTIGESAFENSGITFFNISPGCSVGDNAFKESSSLKILTIGENSSFGTNVFESCSALDYVYLDESPNSFTEGFFISSNPNITIISNSDRNFDLSSLSNNSVYIDLENFSFNSFGISASSDLILDVYIPAFYQGQYISSITSTLISNNDTVTSLVVPPNYHEIPYSFITNCNALSKLFLSDSIKSIGNNAFSDCSVLSDFSLPIYLNSMGYGFLKGTLVNNLIIPKTIDSIPGSAFSECTSLKNIILHSGIKSIGNEAFYNSGLENIEIPPSVKVIGSNAFSNTYYLDSLVLNEGLESIGSYAFRGSGLKSLNLPESLTYIGDEAFSSSDLVSISIPGSLKRISNGAFQYCYNLNTVIIAEGVEEIGHSAFLYCESLTEISIPNTLRIMEPGAFKYCRSLASVSIPGTLINIPVDAFHSCSNLEALNLNEGSRIISKNAFYDTRIKELTLPSTIQLLSDAAFSRNSKMERVIFKGNYPTIVGNPFFTYFNDDITFYRTSGATGFDNISDYIVKYIEVDEGALEFITDDSQATLISCDNLAEGNLIVPATFNNLPVRSISNNAFEGCALINSVELPESIIDIGSSAFADCSSLSLINIPNSVTQIKDSAFYGCIALTSIELPVGLDSIGANAFQNCGLTQIDLPESLTYIGQSAFADCDAIESLNVNASLNLAKSAFSNMDSLLNVYFNGDNIYGASSSIFTGSDLLTEILVLKQATGWSDKFEGVDVIVQTPVYFVGDIPETGLQLFLEEQCIVKAYNDQQDPSLYTYQWYYDSILIPEFLQGRENQFIIEGSDYNQSNWSVEVTDISSGITNTFNFYLDIIRDSDGDGLFDYVETGTGMYLSLEDTGTDPNNQDTDGDTISDKTEILIGLNPNRADSDGDGLTDSQETGTGVYVSINDTGTDPKLVDSDGDGYNDSFEVSLVNFNPTNFNNFQFSDHGMYRINDPTLLNYIEDFRPGSVAMNVENGEAIISMDIHRSTDLVNWEIDSYIEIPISIEEGEATKFFRFKMTE